MCSVPSSFLQLFPYTENVLPASQIDQPSVKTKLEPKQLKQKKQKKNEWLDKSLFTGINHTWRENNTEHWYREIGFYRWYHIDGQHFRVYSSNQVDALRQHFGPNRATTLTLHCTALPRCSTVMCSQHLVINCNGPWIGSYAESKLDYLGPVKQYRSY